MTHPRVVPNGQEITFSESELIVSKTDRRGIITYANDVFTRVCGYTEAELLGQPHNIIRHPDMPRCAFKLMWDTIENGREFFAYVVNLAKNGGYYWVHAHVTPSFDANGQIVGYHSNRRVPHRDALDKIIPVYAALLAEEHRHSDPRAALEAGCRLLNETLASAGMDYDQFVFSISDSTRLEATI